MNSGFKIEGADALQKAIMQAYSGRKAKRIQKEALNAGGDVVVEVLKKNFDDFKDTGYSKDEIMRTDARSKSDIEELKIGWNGEHGRWRLVHLNEFGYTKMGKQYTPKGFGVIVKTIAEVKDEFGHAVAETMRKNL